MSKIIEWIKKDKISSAIVGIGSLVFIIGMIVVVSNFGDTYAAVVPEDPDGGGGVSGDTVTTDIKYVNVHFKANNGTLNGSATLSCSYDALTGATGCKPSGTVPTASRDGYEFRGWGSSSSCSTGITSLPTLSVGNHYYYACWGSLTIDVNINFNSNGGALVGDVKGTCSYTTPDSNCKVENLPTATRDGYDFRGWGTSHDCTSGVTNYIEESTSRTYYACWVSDESNVVATFNPNGGACSVSQLSCNSEDIPSGGNCTVTAPSASRAGYTFTGWSGSSDCSGTKYKTGAGIPFTVDTTFYACWESNDRGAGCYVGATAQGEGDPTWYDEDPDLNNQLQVFKKVGDEECDKSSTPSTPSNPGTSEPDDGKDDTPSTPSDPGTTEPDDGNDDTPSTPSDPGTTEPDDGKDDTPSTPSDPGTTEPDNDEDNKEPEKPSDSKEDDEIKENNKTGDVLIVIAWVIGIGALGYSVYYLRSRKIDI